MSVQSHGESYKLCFIHEGSISHTDVFVNVSLTSRFFETGLLEVYILWTQCEDIKQSSCSLELRRGGLCLQCWGQLSCSKFLQQLFSQATFSFSWRNCGATEKWGWAGSEESPLLVARFPAWSLLRLRCSVFNSMVVRPKNPVSLQGSGWVRSPKSMERRWECLYEGLEVQRRRTGQSWKQLDLLGYVCAWTSWGIRQRKESDSVCRPELCLFIMTCMSSYTTVFY